MTARPPHARRLRGRVRGRLAGSAPLLLIAMACGITERQVEERAESGGHGGVAGGQHSSGFAAGGNASGGLPSFSAGFGGGFVPPVGGNFDPGSGGKALGGMTGNADCAAIPPVEPTCSPASAGQGSDAGSGQGGDAGSGPGGEANAGQGGAGDAGQGGVADEGEGGAASTPPAPAVSCTAGAGGPGSMEDPRGRVMLEDFEDGDDATLFALNGRGVWYVVNDGTGQQFPSPCTLPSLIAGGRGASQRAMHSYGVGFHDQPGGYSLVGMSLRTGAPACNQPIDASAFAGVEFWARGSGVLRFFVPTRATNSAVDLGTCTGLCYDAHGKSVPLTEEWQHFRLPFDMLVQEGWGTPAPFFASQILALHWSAKRAVGDFTPVACFDFWIDDIALYSL